MTLFYICSIFTEHSCPWVTNTTQYFWGCTAASATAPVLPLKILLPVYLKVAFFTAAPLLKTIPCITHDIQQQKYGITITEIWLGFEEFLWRREQWTHFIDYPRSLFNWEAYGDVREKERWKERVGGCYTQMEREDESIGVMISYVQ